MQKDLSSQTPGPTSVPAAGSGRVLDGVGASVAVLERVTQRSDS